MLARKAEVSTIVQCALRSNGDACAVDPCGFCEARPFSVCKAVPDADLALLADAVSAVDLAKGEVLVREDDPATHLFNVTAGSLKISKLLPDGRRQVLGFLFTGDFLGVGRRQRYGFTAEALTPVHLCRFPGRRFLQILDECPAFERELLCRASSELSAAQEQMLLLGRKTARERLASFLSGLSARAERLGAPADPVHLPMTRTDIADYLGLTTETVSRVFTDFRRQGRIRLGETGEVHLLDRLGLAAIAEGTTCPGERSSNRPPSTA
jgi:CRP/FNR family transcriptional regulator, anaerobic regulatory protein